jgi:hypothetical protein
MHHQYIIWEIGPELIQLVNCCRITEFLDFVHHMICNVTHTAFWESNLFLSSGPRVGSICVCSFEHQMLDKA